jgi:transcription-repair coupling factor (superfamily II helicase)
MKRLSALSDYTELGAGFKIAMRDLEIRGAGNLLGDEQSGHVAALGFELYLSMLDEAIRAGGAVDDDEPDPVRLDVQVDAYVPADYVPYEAAKIEVHRRIAAAREVADLVGLRDELADRFGPLPEPLENLVALQHARIRLGEAGARAVTIRQGRMSVTPIDLDDDRRARLAIELPEARYEPGRELVSLPVPEAGAERLPVVVRAADALLGVVRAA